ncbi:MAG: CHAT domain-containing protein [Acidobacteriota bacterium]
MTAPTFFLAVALLAMPLAAHEPPAPAAVETVVRQFYSAWASGDGDGLLAMWEPGSPSLAAFRDETTPLLRVRCMTLHELTVDSLDISGERATVGVHVVLSKHGRTMPERYDPHSATLELVRADGAWRVTRWTLREEEFVDRLLAARNDEERQALLRKEPRLLTPALDRALCRRGVRYANLQRYDDAFVLRNLAANVAAAIPDPAGESLATGLDSILQRLLPEKNLAASLALAYRSATLAEESTDPDAIARSSLRLGRTLYDLGRSGEALPWFERAYSLRDDLEDDSVVSLAAGQISQVYGLRGDHHASMHYARISLATARDDFARAGGEMNLGGEYALGQGDCRLAIAPLLRSVEFARKAGHKDGAAGAAWLLADCYLQTGQNGAALRIISQVLADLGPKPQAEAAQFLLRVRSRYFIRSRRLYRAQADLLEAVRLARASQSDDLHMGALTELANLRLVQRRYIEARAIASDALSHTAAVFEPAVLILAKAERHLGRRGAAYRLLRRLMDTTEEQASASTGDERQRQGFFENRAPAYVELADMLVEDGRFSEALIVAERAKGRLLLDVLRGGKLLQYAALTAAERENEATLERRVSILNLRSIASPAYEETVAQVLREARQQLDDYRAELCSKYPRLAQRATPSALSLHDTSMLLPDSSAAFVEYFVTNAHLVIFVVTRGGGRRALHVHTIPISSRRLESETAALAHALAENDLHFRARSRRLYDLILAPAAAELQGVKTIAIIPDGPLWQLPFESLVMPDGTFVIERMACFYAPSIAVYREMIRHDRPRPSGSFLAFANPLFRKGGEAAEAKFRDSDAGPLPDAEREVARIARLFRDGTKLYVGADALESRVKSESSAYDVIHFATHGVLDDNNPMYSHLLLTASPDSSDDGFLETWELMRLDLHAELAVLSACDTARGAVHAGEGLIGMSWALFVAGCSSTIATQWKVPSASAADLMIDFYRLWLHGRHDTWFAKAEALRQARLNLMRDGKHRDPFYWSGYVLIGSGR